MRVLAIDVRYPAAPLKFIRVLEARRPRPERWSLRVVASVHADTHQSDDNHHHQPRSEFTRTPPTIAEVIGSRTGIPLMILAACDSFARWSAVPTLCSSIPRAPLANCRSGAMAADLHTRPSKPDNASPGEFSSGTLADADDLKPPR